MKKNKRDISNARFFDNKKMKKFSFYLKMKNLPQLPLEIWYKILKIKWQDRCNFLIAFHNSPRNIDHYPAQEIKFDDQALNPKLAEFEGWFEYYKIFNITHIYCTLKYPEIADTKYLQNIIILNFDDFTYDADFPYFSPIEWGNYDKKINWLYTSGLYDDMQKHVSYTNSNKWKIAVKPNTTYYVGSKIEESKTFIHFNKI